MKAKNFLLVSSLIALAFGLLLFLLPKTILSYYIWKESHNSALDTLARFYGTLLIGLGVMFFMARSAQASIARKAIIVGALVSNILLTLAHAQAILSENEKPFAWGTVVLVALLAIWAVLCLKEEHTSD